MTISCSTFFNSQALADMIEACDIDAFIEGPSWGKGISPQAFTQKLLQMQEARLRAVQSQAAPGECQDQPGACRAREACWGGLGLTV